MLVVFVVTILVYLFLSLMTLWIPIVIANAFSLSEDVTSMWWALGTLTLSFALAVFVKSLPESAPVPDRAANIRPHLPSRPTAKPGTLHNLSPLAFEQYCVEWARWIGYQDASATRAVKDGGYDIESGRMIGQVKFQETPVGVKPIRELYGVAQNQGKRATFFSLNGYSKEGKAEADSFGIALFTVKPFSAEIFADNSEARRQLTSTP